MITAADLEQMGAKNIIEALERIPGVYNTSSANTYIAHYATDGYEEEDESRTAGLVKLGYNLSALTRIGVRGNWVTRDQDRAYGLGKSDWHLAGYRRSIHFPRSETDDRLVWHNRQEQDSGTYAVEFAHKGFGLFVNGNVSYTHYKEIQHDTKDIAYSTARTRGKVDDRLQDTCTATLSGGYRFTTGRLGYTPTFGVNYEKVGFRQRRSYPYDPDGLSGTLAYDLDLTEDGYGAFWDNDFAWGRIGD